MFNRLTGTSQHAGVSHHGCPPGQVVRSRLQQRMARRAIQYRSGWDVLRITLRREGVGGLYKGLLPNVLRVMPQVRTVSVPCTPNLCCAVACSWQSHPCTKPSGREVMRILGLCCCRQPAPPVLRPRLVLTTASASARAHVQHLNL